MFSYVCYVQYVYFWRINEAFRLTFRSKHVWTFIEHTADVKTTVVYPKHVPWMSTFRFEPDGLTSMCILNLIYCPSVFDFVVVLEMILIQGKFPIRSRLSRTIDKPWKKAIYMISKGFCPAYILFSFPTPSGPRLIMSVQ